MALGDRRPAIDVQLVLRGPLGLLGLLGLLGPLVLLPGQAVGQAVGKVAALEHDALHVATLVAAPSRRQVSPNSGAHRVSCAWPAWVMQ